MSVIGGSKSFVPLPVLRLLAQGNCVGAEKKDLFQELQFATQSKIQLANVGILWSDLA
jgi:hypothetical protein